MRRTALAVAVAMGLAGVGFATVVERKVPADQVYLRGQALFNAGKWAEARPYFQQAQRMAPLSTTAIHSAYFEGITYLRENKWKEAEEVFTRLVARYPDGLNAPEAQYHVGLTRQQQGNREGAIAAWEETRTRFPDSPWAGHAGERLAEMRR